MNVRMPPRFGIWAVAGVAMVAIQRTAPRPAAATPDLLIMASLLLLSRMDRCTNPGIICGEASIGAELVALDESNTPRCRPPQWPVLTSRRSGRIRRQLATAIGQRG